MTTRRALVPLAAVALATALAAAAGAAWPVFLAGNGAVVAALVADWRGARRAEIDVERPPRGPYSIGRANELELVVASRAGRPVVVTLADASPAGAALSPLVHELELAPGETARLPLVVVPRRRGPLRFASVGARVLGPWGLCFAQRRFPATAAEELTWPDVLQLRDERLLPPGRRPGGVRPAPAGERQREFESLRAYVPGDDYRRISWKATARRGEPVVANTRPERRQTLVLAVEAGRLMVGGGGDGLDKLDRAVNASVMLAAAAREFDDAVGLVSFADRPLAALGASSGAGQVGRVVRAVADAQAALTEPDWAAGLAAAAHVAGRRSLLVVFSDVHYVEADEALATRLGLLARRHAVVFASVLDAGLAREAALPVVDGDSLFRRGTAAALLERRRRALLVLARRGVRGLDVAPEQLTGAVVAAFRDLRRQGVV